MSSLCAVFNEGSFVHLKDLNEEDKAFHMSNIEYAKKLITICIATSSLDKTYQEMMELSEQYRNEQIGINQFVNSVSVKCESFLSSVRGYVDSFAHTLSSEFGAEALHLFEREKKSCFDSNFSYRLVDQIRNYCQHRAAPIHGVNAYMVDGHKRINVFANTKALIDDKKFRTTHLSDLELHFPERIDLLYHFGVTYGCLKNMNHVIFMNQYNVDKVKCLFDTAYSFLNGANDIAVIDTKTTQEGKVTMHIWGRYMTSEVDELIKHEMEIDSLLRRVSNGDTI